MYLVKSPSLLKWYYSDLIWNKPSSEKIVYLTFDDGPIPNVTEFVLNTLNKFEIKATFFCIGDNINKHPAIFNRIKKEGHSIGNHTYNHLNGWKTDNETYVENFLKCQQLTQSSLFRPPYGRIKKSQIASLRFDVRSQKSEDSNLISQISNLKIVMWDVLSGDFDVNLSPGKCYENVIKNAENGSIVVFHDSLKAFERLEYALPKVLSYFTEKGYQFEAL